MVSLLDITLNLFNNKYQTYNQPDITPLYINTNSDQVSNITKNLAENISHSINKLSLHEAVFVNSKIFVIVLFPKVDLNRKVTLILVFMLQILVALNDKEQKWFCLIPCIVVTNLPI